MKTKLSALEKASCLDNNYWSMPDISDRKVFYLVKVGHFTNYRFLLQLYTTDSTH